MIPIDSDKEEIQSLDRAFRLVGYIQNKNGVTLSKLNEHFDLSKSSILRHMNTLEKHGYIVKENGAYYIGMRFLDLGIHARDRRQEYQAIKPKVDLLADETGERAQFITEENMLGYHVYTSIGENGIRSESQTGERVYLHVTSVGKTILASLSESRVNEILDCHGLPALTETTITNREQLFEDLETIREQGYAINQGERRNGMMAVGAPIKASDGDILGGISVTGPTRRMESEHLDTLPNLLLDLTEDINLRLRYSQD